MHQRVHVQNQRHTAIAKNGGAGEGAVLVNHHVVEIPDHHFLLVQQAVHEQAPDAGSRLHHHHDALRRIRRGRLDPEQLVKPQQGDELPAHIDHLQAVLDA